MGLPRARAHETPPADRQSAGTDEPLLCQGESLHAAGASPAAGLLGAFDTSPWDGNETGRNGGECSSHAAGDLFCSLEERLEELLEIELDEELDEDLFDCPDPPEPPKVLPDPIPDPAPAPSEALSLLTARGVLPEVAAGLAADHDLPRIRDVCELAALKGWNTAGVVRCFSTGWDREKTNQRRLATARGAPGEPPTREAAVKHPAAISLPPVDDAYRRWLKGEETAAEREAAEAAAAFIRQQMTALFPERAGEPAPRRPDPIPEAPILSSASDPRPIADILAERKTAPRPRA